MKRGEIYLVKNRYAFGAEISKARPAVIVSNDILNATSEVAEVVYLTTKPKKELPTHANIQATGVPSTALCEQIDSVSVKMLCAKVGDCSEEEMANIDRALKASLGLSVESAEPKKEPEAAETFSTEDVEGIAKWIKVAAERDAYKEILDKLLDRGGCADG